VLELAPGAVEVTDLGEPVVLCDGKQPFPEVVGFAFADH
jgi:hypothetical protein